MNWVFLIPYFRFLFAPMFVHLNCHSNYSFLGETVLGLTRDGSVRRSKNSDHSLTIPCPVMGGASRIDELVRQASTLGYPALALTDTNGLYGAVPFYQSAIKAGIKPILGAEIVSGNHRAVLLAKNMQGFAELCRVITDRHLKPDFSLPLRLQECSEHLIILCSNLEMLQPILKIRGTKNIYYQMGLSPHSNMPSLCPVVATNPVRFIHPEGWQVHRLLTAIKMNTTVYSVPQSALASREAWMKSPAMMARVFHEFPSAISNTQKIAEQCNVKLPTGQPLFPYFSLPSASKTNQHGYLKKLAWKGVLELYRNTRYLNLALQQLRHELKVIHGLNFSSYFLIVWDIVRESKTRNIPTVGRGSAANSLVCRALGITEVDPIAQNLYFERFLNPERTDYPDIDIDFPWNRRDEMLNYVFQKYGSENVALICAHVHFRGRSALREVGKALAIPIPEIDAFTSRLPHSVCLSELQTVRDTIPECRDLPLEDEPYRSMVSLAKHIEGFPSHLSIHCGGIVISPFPIVDRIPLQHTQKGFVVTQYDMYPVEDMGLLKIDLLAQKGLAVLADTLHNVEKNYGLKIDFNQIDPVQDPKTQRLIRAGKTIGCFYIESPGMRNLLRKLNVDSFEMLTAVSSIIRPGVSDSGMMKTFIERHIANRAKHQAMPQPPIVSSPSSMDEILRDTYGIMIYQEDVIKVAHTIGGMSLGEADSLRKCMSKKRDWQDINTHRERFVSGAMQNRFSQKSADEIWRQIESFAGYAFCKAHSASFAIVSFQTAYLKAHYPAEFMAAVLSNRGGFYDACVYTEEARRMNIKILPPDINRSDEPFTAHHKTIRVGLSQIKKLKKISLDAILNNHPYTSFADFMARSEVSLSELESLIRCGAFSSLGVNKAGLLWQLKLHHRPSLCKQALFAPVSLQIPKLADDSLHENLLAELECLDLTVSGHRLNLYSLQNHKLSQTIIQGNQLENFSGRLATLIGWAITFKHARTVKNERMKFMTLEDATATFEVTLFPGVYKQFGHLLYDHGPYIIRGRIDPEGDSVTALWLKRLQPVERLA
ncbi:MAG: DNA polymerase III subunit alpha [Nitrospina sp.]|nr:DNA polymerase III subunit alpha [Nitrospina sp.]